MADDNVITRRLTEKQSRFLSAYLATGKPVDSAISAGYSVKSAAIEACRLLKHPTIVLEIANWRKEKYKSLSKEDFVDIAMDRFNKLEVTEPNSPRFLDLAGKALGHIGANNQQNSQTTNVQINIALTGSESQTELWEITRKLLGNQ